MTAKLCLPVAATAVAILIGAPALAQGVGGFGHSRIVRLGLADGDTASDALRHGAFDLTAQHATHGAFGVGLDASGFVDLERTEDPLEYFHVDGFHETGTRCAGAGRFCADKQDCDLIGGAIAVAWARGTLPDVLPHRSFPMTLSRPFATLTLIAGLGLSAAALPALAQDQNPAVAARQGLMQEMSLNLGVLGGMARGTTDYDPETAQAAADNLVAIGMIDQRFHWPEGTDSDSIEGTRALPAIWAAESGMLAIWDDFDTAAAGLAAAAGGGLDPLRAAMGPMGATCGACHDTYRQSR